ncbi:alpha/beta fold hydrolase [Parahaliea mediterranea]|uniref:alpha/beta fold hydrolase n=1 Tax=Parahaliea mediterranea TaxID=651086 RepID=UPI001F4DD262|nr:alpha/beta fold hydrolase [Parahaliea mediterranea]
MSLHIHSSTQGEGPDAILLHGLFGMGNNLGALARALRGEFRVHCLDLPNHGRSDWLAQMTLASLADGIRAWQQQQGIGRAHFVGHSLGGKVAMRIALDAPDTVGKLVVADIAPVDYPPHHDAIFAALQAVAAAAPASRSDAEAIMAGFISEAGVRQFLLLSLASGEDGRYRWRFNLEGLLRDYGAARQQLATREPFTRPVLFIKGELSDYILPAHRPIIEALFPNASLRVLQGCGHWLHAEQPRLFNATVRRFLLAD